MIEELELANVYWTPEQLAKMTPETFVMTVETLGNVPDFSMEQLDALWQKASEVQLSQGCGEAEGNVNLSHSLG